MGWKCETCGAMEGSDNLRFPIMHETVNDGHIVVPDTGTALTWGHALGMPAPAPAHRYVPGVIMLRERGLLMATPKDMEQAGVPPIVGCVICTRNMPVFACWVREDGAIVCPTCADKEGS